MTQYWVDISEAVTRACCFCDQPIQEWFGRMAHRRTGQAEPFEYSHHGCYMKQREAARLRATRGRP